jgi:guanine deaminase
MVRTGADRKFTPPSNGYKLAFMDKLICGQLIWYEGDPLRNGPAVARHLAQGAVLMSSGRIAARGDATTLRADHPGVPVTDYGTALISAGFVDAHVHYPQTAIIASWGKRLIDWLNTYTFPEEARFADPAYAAAIANRYLDLVLARGTTTVCTYGTIHPASVDAIFAAAQARGMRVFAGKTCMDRNAPDNLRDTVQSAYDDSKTLLERWAMSLRPGFRPPPRPNNWRSWARCGAHIRIV